MQDDMRHIVETGYEKGDYESAYRQSRLLTKREERFFKKLLELIPEKAKILDLGSGTGIPYDRYLVKRGVELTGIDISSKHIAMARKNVPEATYIKADFSRTGLGKRSVHAVISMYAIFHIPRSDHAALFAKIHAALKDNGILLLTMGTSNIELGIDEFIGSRMAWSSFSIPENKQMVEDAGFKLLLVEEQHEDPQEHHLWILAQKA
ncbi:MAG: class I SAM-dependent methyltransferase [Candidatus Thorarchaeota archaeon]